MTHLQSLTPWKHAHRFHLAGAGAEHRTIAVVALTGTVMVVEIIAGILTHSMALLADGWHMSTHMAALAIAVVAYRIARRREDDRRYTFGTGKVGVLGGYTSAVFLALIAVLMAGESIHRFVSPKVIEFDWAIRVAVLGLVVNLVSAAILGQRPHRHENGHGHAPHHDHNLKAAYLHVLADALTSMTAIVALVTGKYMGWAWMDPLMGIVGASVICVWAYGLLRDTSRILLDRQPDGSLTARIHELIEADSDTRIADLHVWQVGSGNLAAIISLVTDEPKPPQHYRRLVSGIAALAHVTIEVNPCE
ncbi:MAG: CDF family Co(II)/Ni(II) efflux transporter DmeF [Candidatus Zixiibacteriota bacterium]